MMRQQQTEDANTTIRALPEFQTSAWLTYFTASDAWDTAAKPWHRKWRRVPRGLRHSMLVRFRLGPYPSMPSTVQYVNAVMKMTYVPVIAAFLNSPSPLLSHLRRAA